MGLILIPPCRLILIPPRAPLDRDQRHRDTG
nr:MAG TPA: hypothetical protein [Caudoviricetes sp.]